MVEFKPRKISIVIPILNSYAVVRRQIKYFAKMNLPDSIEIIFMDDGSNPPLKPLNWGLKNFNIYPTGDFRPWTQTAAKNLGVKIAEGEFVFITDIDHILTREALVAVESFEGDKMEFPREYAILNNHGDIIRDLETLVRYGFKRENFRKRGLHAHQHVNTFAMRRSVFIEIGGYKPKYAEMQKHDIYDDNYLYHRYLRHVAEGKAKAAVIGPPIFTFPNTGRDIKGLFHNLSRES